MSFKVSREHSLDNPEKCKSKATASGALRAARLKGFAGDSITSRLPQMILHSLQV